MDTSTDFAARGIVVDEAGYLVVPPVPTAEALPSSALDAIRRKPVELPVGDWWAFWVVTDECGAEVGAATEEDADRLVAYYRQRALDYPSQSNVAPTKRPIGAQTAGLFAAPIYDINSDAARRAEKRSI